MSSPEQEGLAAQIPASLSRLKEGSSHLCGFGRPPGPPYIGDVCLVAKVGLGVQRISGRPEFTYWESKIDAGSSPDPNHGTKMLGKHHTLHTKEAHERYLISKV
jgi:hypothetical protein